MVGDLGLWLFGSRVQIVQSSLILLSLKTHPQFPRNNSHKWFFITKLGLWTVLKTLFPPFYRVVIEFLKFYFR